MVDTIVLGLDGANWNLVKPWLSEGYLPNLSELRKSGTHGDLQSCLPAVTCPNWRCYSTGKNPGKLGVYWWERIDKETQSLTTPDSRSFKSSNYWDYLNDAGYSSGVMNLPMTYPPVNIDRFMIAGGPRSEQSEYAKPEEIEKYLEDRDYRLHPDQSISSSNDISAASEIINLIDDRLTTFRELLQRQSVDVAHLTVFYSNVLQHWFWRGEPTKEAWKVIDEHLGKIREEFPDANLILMSDHGCDEVDTTFYVNSWLEQKGYLVRKGGSSTFEQIGINKRKLANILGKLGPARSISKIVPEKLKSRIPEDEMGFKREQKLEQINWEKSQAIASGQGLIYVLDDNESTTNNLIEELRTLTSDITGDPVCSKVYKREELYHGEYVDKSPEIIFEQYPGLHTTGAIGDNPVFTGPDGWHAENVRTGLYLVSGPDIVSEGPNQASITDIAPTILHGMGCDIPTDFDGKPLGVFPGEATTRDPIPYSETHEARTSETMQSRLEDLGYLS